MAFVLINIGYTDGVNNNVPRFPRDVEYMEGYNKGLQDHNGITEVGLTPGRRFQSNNKDYQEMDLPL